MNEVIVRIVTKETLPEFAKEILELVKGRGNERAQVIALSGDLGAGKTAFTKALGQALGVAEEITSPTFTIMKGYETTDDIFTHLVHMDAYRIEDEDELRPLRFAEILDTPKTLVVVEWARLVAGAIPPVALHLTFSVEDENTRTVQID
ncbi:MAG: hypothetical protein RL538_805 [Candidatus Parcubacteria bacterium]|jgi:tRNA threonylcarbamoyladenosine biosynthesis protein TsaE